MALSYTIEGKGVIANADNYGTDTAGGSWGVTGSGGASASATTDTFYYGSTSISTAVSGANKWAWVYHDIGAGNELDFTATTGTEADQFIYIWIHCPTIGLSKTLANEGVSIRVGSTTSDYRIFVVAGSDGSNGWDGGWQCFVIDPTKSGSITDVGSPNLASIRYIGAQLETTATAKGDNLFISQIAVGSGLRITGTSTTAWLDAVTYCTDLPNRAWGMLQEREGIYYAYGNIIIGDATATTDFDDEARVVQFGISEYWSGTGTTFNTSLPTTASGISLDDGTGTTTFTDGVLVSPENGRSGSTIIGNSNENVFFDCSAIAAAGSDINLYGTTFSKLTGAITLVDDVDHVYYGVNWVGCSQVDPVGAPIIRNNTFAETADIDAALLWNSTIDIEDCNFIANTTGAAIEMLETTNQDYDNLQFSGNTNDTLLNNGTPGTNINISKSNTSNPTSYENAPSNTATITYVGAAVTTTVVTQKGDGSRIPSCRVFLAAANATGAFPNAYNASVTLNATASTTVTATHTAHGLASGDKVVIYNADNQLANGVFVITVTGTNTYTYTANGTVTLSGDAANSTFVALEGITSNTGVLTTTGTLSASRVYPSNKEVSGWARNSTKVNTTAGNFKVGAEYIITTIGTTNFTLIGATANTVGLRFRATGVGTGTGTADTIRYKTAPLSGTIDSSLGLTLIGVMVQDE